MIIIYKDSRPFPFQMKNFFLMVKETLGQDKSAAETNLTRMMFSVVFTFIICNTFYHLLYIFYYFSLLGPDTYIVLRPLNIFLLTINSSINIVFYTLFLTAFRQNLFALFNKVKTKENEEISLQTKSTKESTDWSQRFLTL